MLKKLLIIIPATIGLVSCSTFSAFDRIDENAKNNIQKIGVVSYMDDVFTIFETGPLLSGERTANTYILPEIKSDDLIASAITSSAKKYGYDIRILSKPADVQAHIDSLKQVIENSKQSDVDAILVFSRIDFLPSGRRSNRNFDVGFGYVDRNILLTNEKCLFVNYSFYLIDQNKQEVLLTGLQLETRCNETTKYSLDISNAGAWPPDELSRLRKKLQLIANSTVESNMTTIGLFPRDN